MISYGYQAKFSYLCIARKFAFVHSIHTIYTALYGVVWLYAVPNITFVCVTWCTTAIRMFEDHHCVTLFSYEHPTSAIFPRVSWNALQPVGFVSLLELLSRCHRGRRPGNQVLLLLSRLSFTAHGNWKLFRSVCVELWGTLECFISKESGIITWQALELWTTACGRGVDGVELCGADTTALFWFCTSDEDPAMLSSC